MNRPIRVLVAKVGLDGHDRGAKVIATALRDAGMEVIYTGLRQTPEMVVTTALQEDVDAIGISILSGAHMTVFPKILQLLKEKKMNDVLLTGGGIIPEDDMKKLNEMGVGKLFAPGTPTIEIANYISDWVKQTEVFKKHFMYQTLLTSLENAIFTITINRPDKMNALNKMVMDELNAAIDEVYNNAEIKSVIITGAGQKAFVAGADISEFVGLSKEQGMAMAKKGQGLFFKIENCPKPIIAAVNGFALGGGCELAMSCHFRIASENAKFGQPEVNLGLTPGYGGTQRIVQLIGKGRAIELLISANMIDATTALHYGLVNHIAPLEVLLQKARSILEGINSKAPLAVAGCINAANAVFDESQNGFETEVKEFGKCFVTEDMKEGTSAFLEKRKANFSGK